jgi:hypothetical protein
MRVEKVFAVEESEKNDPNVKWVYSASKEQARGYLDIIFVRKVGEAEKKHSDVALVYFVGDYLKFSRLVKWVYVVE